MKLRILHVKKRTLHIAAIAVRNLKKSQIALSHFVDVFPLYTNIWRNIRSVAYKLTEWLQ